MEIDYPPPPLFLLGAYSLLVYKYLTWIVCQGCRGEDSGGRGKQNSAWPPDQSWPRIYIFPG